jgi:hypothetical protein
VIPAIFGNNRRRLGIFLVFVAGPLVLHLAVVNPLLNRMTAFRDQVKEKASSNSLFTNSPAPASDNEWTRLEEIKESELARLKMVDSRESMLQFSGALADALASDAQSYGLKVTGIDLDNALIKATYVPSGERALERLDAISGVRWIELKDPLELPMRHLPSIDVQMTVASEYSKVFSFIEALPEFPVPVALASLATVDGAHGKAFRLKIRGYYYSPSQTPRDTPMNN